MLDVLDGEIRTALSTDEQQQSFMVQLVAQLFDEVDEALVATVPARDRRDPTALLALAEHLDRMVEMADHKGGKDDAVTPEFVAARLATALGQALSWAVTRCPVRDVLYDLLFALDLDEALLAGRVRELLWREAPSSEQPSG